MICSIFLRGINTGSLKLMNEDFNRILYETGCSNVKTIQAAGTAVFTVDTNETDSIKLEIEKAISKFMGKDIPSVLRTKEQIDEIIKQIPLIKSNEAFHDYIMLTDDPNLYSDVVKAHDSIPYSDGERIINFDGFFLWTIQKGNTLNDFGSKVLGSSKFKSRLTSRNMNTIVKVADTMNNLQSK